MLVTPRLSEGIYFLEATISNSFTRKESVKEGFPENDLIRKKRVGKNQDDDNGEETDENGDKEKTFPGWKIKMMTLVKKYMKVKF